MTNTLLKEFVDFVNSKPADMEIDHDNGWDNCAIGKFYDSKYPEVDCSEKSYGIVEFAALIFQVDHNTYDINFESTEIDAKQIQIYKNLNHCRYDTYGDLAAELNALNI